MSKDENLNKTSPVSDYSADDYISRKDFEKIRARRRKQVLEKACRKRMRRISSSDKEKYFVSKIDGKNHFKW